jgi:para-nitrobenzyl esterase
MTRNTITCALALKRAVCIAGLALAGAAAVLAQAPALAQAPPKTSADPSVTVKSGHLRGSLTADGVAVFKNIPFAQPPVGDRRWKEPLPESPWKGVRDATGMGPMCHQNDNKQFRHDEDCLQLNVWTQKWPMTSQVPVMVWIHGGGNTAGSGIEALFNGETLARHGLVLVTVNYRLGLFGFFSHPGLKAESSHHATGNYGLQDQIRALQWVKENIARFGGNPANVTVVGESAGAADVNALIASPLAKGLFQRVIAESGPVGATPTRAEAEKSGEEFAARFGFSGDQAVAKLRALSFEELLAKTGPGAGPGPSLSISADGWVLPESPQKIFADGRQQKVALLIGSNSQEMQGGRGIATAADLRDTITQRFGPLADRALTAYGFNGSAEPAVDPDYGPILTQWTTDTSFRCGTVQELNWHTAAGNTGYQYQFSRTVHGKEPMGAAHASEIPFVFGTLPVWQKRNGYNDSDKDYAKIMQAYWTNFADKGDPNGEGLVKWPKYDATARAYLNFSDAGPVAREGLRRAVCDVYIDNQKRLAIQ